MVWRWWKNLKETWNSALNASGAELAQTLDMKPDIQPHQEVRAAPVFASYSRKDAILVSQLLGLFRATDLPVFRDEDSIKPGRKWRIAINEALENCQTILVFWCGHAAQSSEVQNEYQRAISLDKRVVPVLMENAELPTELGQYQGVDLRMVVGDSHGFLVDVFEEKVRNMTTSACEGPGWEQALEAKRRRFAAADDMITRASQHLERSLESIL